MGKANIKHIALIWFVSLFSSFIIAFFYSVFPPASLEKHVPHGSNEVLERNYDGPIYVLLAKTLYKKQLIEEINFNKLPFIYYANHFPLFPILIRLISFITNSYFRAMILLSWLSTALFTTFFYFFLKKFKITNQPLLLSLISLFIPARWLAVRTVGSTEPLFLLLLIISLYLWFDKKYFLSSIFASLLVIIRPPGIIFFFSFLTILCYHFLTAKNKEQQFLQTLKQNWVLILMPLSLFVLFWFYQSIFKNFWAFFQAARTTTANSFKLMPFSATIGYNTPMAEGFLYLYAIYIIGIYLLWRQKQKQLAIFSLVYLIPFFLIGFTDDLFRFFLPISPFCLIIGYQKIIKHKTFKYFFLFFLIGIYIYTLSLLPNRMFHYWDYADLRVIVK